LDNEDLLLVHIYSLTGKYSVLGTEPVEINMLPQLVRYLDMRVVCSHDMVQAIFVFLPAVRKRSSFTKIAHNIGDLPVVANILRCTDSKKCDDLAIGICQTQ